MRYQTQCECNLLEPDDAKVSSPVLRGLGGSNASRLPDEIVIEVHYDKDESDAIDELEEHLDKLAGEVEEND